MPHRKYRFPRLELTDKEKAYEKIIHHCWNQMARSRNINYRNFNYDVYKIKHSWKIIIAFQLLAVKLHQLQIDPERYIKTICRYGHYKDSKYMPNPQWVAKDKALKIFKWLYRKERGCYVLHLDWKKSMNGWTDIDIADSARKSAEMVKSVRDTDTMTEKEAVSSLDMLHELSPWFMAAYIRFRNRDVSEAMYFLNRHRDVGSRLVRVLEKSLGKQKS